MVSTIFRFNLVKSFAPWRRWRASVPVERLLRRIVRPKIVRSLCCSIEWNFTKNRARMASRVPIIETRRQAMLTRRKFISARGRLIHFRAGAAQSCHDRFHVRGLVPGRSSQQGHIGQDFPTVSARRPWCGGQRRGIPICADAAESFSATARAPASRRGPTHPAMAAAIRRDRQDDRLQRHLRQGGARKGHRSGNPAAWPIQGQATEHAVDCGLDRHGRQRGRPEGSRGSRGARHD